MLIPARNEARSIRAAVDAVLTSQDVTLEVIVLDDHSEDETASVVRQMAAQDPRVRLETTLMTDICDVTRLATCRMYRGFAELWNGLAKNATEGLAAPATIVPATVLLLGGQVMPVILFAYGLLAPMSTAGRVLTCLAVVAAYYPRISGCLRFSQSWRGTLLHPCEIVLLLGIQWYALGRATMGRPAVWKGRPYVTASTRGQIEIADGN